MKKLVLFLISIMAVGIFGCVSLRNKPDTVVENYYNALSSADYDSAYLLICEGDKKRLDLMTQDSHKRLNRQKRLKDL